jgi:hypothetical protein
MSQHIFQTTYEGNPVTVMMGWDRQQQDFFLFVDKLHYPEALSDNDVLETAKIIYDSDADSEAKQQGLDYHMSTLIELGIHVPASMFKQMHHDQGFGGGNRVCTYADDGSFGEIHGPETFFKKIGWFQRPPKACEMQGV